MVRRAGARRHGGGEAARGRLGLLRPEPSSVRTSWRLRRLAFSCRASSCFWRGFSAGCRRWTRAPASPGDAVGAGSAADREGSGPGRRRRSCGSRRTTAASRPGRRGCRRCRRACRRGRRCTSRRCPPATGAWSAAVTSWTVRLGALAAGRLPEGLMSGVSPPRVRPARTEQTGQAPGPWPLRTFSATAICWSLVARSARARVDGAAVGLPGGLGELQPAVVAVAGVDAPVVAGLAGGDLVPGVHVGRVRDAGTDERERHPGAARRDGE